MENVKQPRQCVFSGHGSMQHADGGWKCNYASWYHLYLIPGDLNSEAALSFLYGYQLQFDIFNKREVLFDDAAPLNLSHEKEGADGNMSINTVTSVMTGITYKNRAVNLLLDHLVDMPIEENQDRISAQAVLVYFA